MANIKTYPRGHKQRLSNNFSLSEYECKCKKCPETKVDLDHVAKLQKLREDLNSPIIITSAYRCPDHNKAVGGSPSSSHTTGTATDIVISGMEPGEVQDACESFDGLGRYDIFTHIDSRGNKARWDERTRKDYLPSGPSEEDIEVKLQDLEDDLGI